MTERTLFIEEKRIHLRESAAQDGGGPVLLCIHGNLGSGRWFEPLAERYPGRVIAPDMPNFGQSDHIDEWTMAVYAGWIGKICDELGVTKPAVLGHSLGGAVAMELLATRPELVGELILVDSSPIDGLVTPREYHPAIEAYKSDKGILAQALKGVVPMLTDDAFFAKLVDDAWQMNRDCFIGHAEVLGTADYRERLKDTSLPVQVIHGAQDVLIPADRAETQASFFGTTVRTFQNSGHSPMVEAAEEFAAAVREILGAA